MGSRPPRGVAWKWPILLFALSGLGVLAWIALLEQAGGPKEDPVPSNDEGQFATPTQNEERKDPVSPEAPITSQPFDFRVEWSHAASARVPGSESSHQIQGSVLGPSREPLPEVTVRLIHDVSSMSSAWVEGEFLCEIRTDQDGRFQFVGLALDSSYALHASHERFAPHWVSNVTVQGSKSTPIVLELRAGAVIQGTVRDSANAPVAMAEVSVDDGTLVSTRLLTPERKTLTRSDGTYTVSALSPGLKSVFAVAPGLSREGRYPIRLDAGATVTGIDFVLQGGVTLRGRVVDEVRGTPVARAIVRAVALVPLESESEEASPEARGDSDPSAGRIPAKPSTVGLKRGPDARKRSFESRTFIVARALTDSEGRFELSGLLPSICELVVEKTGYRTRKTQVSTQDGELALITLKPLLCVRGRVVNAAGEPLSEFTLASSLDADPNKAYLSGHQAICNKDGRFEYFAKETLPFHLHVFSPAREIAVSEKLSPLSRSDIEGLNLVVSGGATLVGRVLDTSGQPLAWVSVKVVSESLTPGKNPFAQIRERAYHPSTKVTVRTDENGHFLAKGLSEGTFVATASLSGYASGSSSPSLVSRGAETRIPPIELKRGAVVKGVVRRPDGLPDAEATVGLRSVPEGPVFSVNALTNEHGSYEIRDLAPGTYEIFLARKQGAVNLGLVREASRNNLRKISLAEAEVLTLDL